MKVFLIYFQSFLSVDSSQDRKTVDSENFKNHFESKYIHHLIIRNQNFIESPLLFGYSDMRDRDSLDFFICFLFSKSERLRFFGDQRINKIWTSSLSLQLLCNRFKQWFWLKKAIFREIRKSFYNKKNSEREREKKQPKINNTSCFNFQRRVEFREEARFVCMFGDVFKILGEFHRESPHSISCVKLERLFNIIFFILAVEIAMHIEILFFRYF